MMFEKSPEDLSRFILECHNYYVKKSETQTIFSEDTEEVNILLSGCSYGPALNEVKIILADGVFKYDVALLLIAYPDLAPVLINYASRYHCECSSLVLILPDETLLSFKTFLAGRFEPPRIADFSGELEDFTDNIPNCDEESNVNITEELSPGDQSGSDFICELCGTSYSSAKSLEKHQYDKHPKEKRKKLQRLDYVCKVCNMHFIHKYMLTRHSYVHKIATFVCEICLKSFKFRNNLVKHFSSCHSETKPLYSCDICQKTFDHKKSLVRHSKIHLQTNEEKYECQVCHKVFNQKSNYHRHYKLHQRTL